MKNSIKRYVCLVILNLFFIKVSFAGIEPIPSGSFIINMGVTPQTYINGLKPWGMIYDLVKNYKVQIKWVINQTKLRDGTDFVYNGTNYRGGTFVIPVKYRTSAVNTRIAYWQSQGVVGVTTTIDLNLDVTYTLKYTPRWTFDTQNGNIAMNFLTEAGIPTAGFQLNYPIQLDPCDDLFVMPHADPTWATHSNLYTWNRGNNGWIWAGCHAVSVLENLVNPGNPTQQMNFLSQTGLVDYGSHDDGSPPYSYRYPTDAEMQFIGNTEAAQQNGSEQIFLPQGSTWRPTTKVAVYDPSQDDVPSISPGEAAAIVYGRGFGVDTMGKVMYVGGHNVDKNNADAVAAIRNFFNFSFLSRYDKLVNFTITGNITVIAYNNYTYRANMPVNVNPNNFTYSWSSTCGGSFSNPNDSVTMFTAPASSSCFECRLICSIADTCGRDFYQDYDIQVCPAGTLAVSILKFSGNKAGADNLLKWQTNNEINTELFEIEYSTDGFNYTKIGSLDASGTTSGIKDYSYTHKQVQGKTSYYRLKLISLDGKYQYSEVISVDRDAQKYIVYPVYPNPFDHQMTVSIDAESNSVIDLMLADMQGKIIITKTFTLKKGSNKVEFNQLGKLSPGTYFIRISNEDLIKSMKLVKTTE